MFKLDSSDALKGVITAIIAGVVVSLYGVVTQAGFDVFAADWGSILHMAINGAVAAFFGYIGKNLLTDTSGKFMGKI